MITPFTVYLVMQADKFSALLATVSILAVLITLVIVILGALQSPIGDDPVQLWRKHKLKMWICIAASAGMAFTLMPSTNTLAAMFIAPAIANSEVVQKDVPELYNLAVEALKQKLGGGK
jgi:hypothetical protein